nr:helix-turn-helix transcriptional regulator [Propionibacterium sp.]
MTAAYRPGGLRSDLSGHSDWECVGGVFRALGSPLRVGIVVLLEERPRSVTELVQALDVSQPLVSQHLRVLRAAGMVRARRQGREVFYSLTDADVPALVASAGRQVREHPPAGLRRVPALTDGDAAALPPPGA